MICDPRKVMVSLCLVTETPQYTNSAETVSFKKTHTEISFFLLFDRRRNMQLLTVNYRIKIINRAELTKGNTTPITLHSKIL